ncbi:zinc ribbon domain-containing protein [Agarivorans sp. QJM3NY_33]|uniref:zinc ribbon domain-containing protein n=1 Tax=Agarivorans sp. QJM3NY_33 TaxID=3421432 RepID=UPI003D7ED9E9
MSANNDCPDCGKALDWDGQYYCASCQQHYQKLAYCPDCDAALEKLAACGAASYFCNSSSCNELKSKSRARVEFKPIA